MLPRGAHVQQRADHADHAVLAAGDLQSGAVGALGEQRAKKPAQQDAILVHGGASFHPKAAPSIAQTRAHCKLDQSRKL